ncbi:hypothetical protein PQU92_02705 [Asticcacaulis sp. BYS171W]|uniref:Nucleotidyltransferase n=1 Tax=Asticcacaulis aquaticus TaxID=2984212 RepID=A0ABT5HQ18_9CAUL|nr:hypothetical protein [Asticcacaulis aquaticus]MDC7682168.1 hypothetical protein [Asticcacaulis aquaticus]
MLPQASFKRFLYEIEPSKTTSQNCARAYASVRNFLFDHEDYRDLTRDVFVAGSYARDTAIRPRKINGRIKAPDVDIMVVTDHTRADHPEDVLQDLADVLAAKYNVKRTNRRSVRLESYGCQVDVVPVAYYRNKFRLPDRDAEEWIYTNPPRHKEWSTSQNQKFGKRFKPLVKMLKWWRQEHVSGKRPKGFLMEILVASYGPADEIHLGEAFAQTLENICHEYFDAAMRGRKPIIIDPAMPENNMLDGVSAPQWQAFIDKVRIHAQFARKAQISTDLNKAVWYWQKVFGDQFTG